MIDLPAFKAFLRRVVKIAKVLAAVTSTTLDDEAVALLERLIDSEFFDISLKGYDK